MSPVLSPKIAKVIRVLNTAQISLMKFRKQTFIYLFPESGPSILCILLKIYYYFLYDQLCIRYLVEKL